MLVSLSVRNVVLIEKLDLTFHEGLSVFTGETGAGKSILLDSLSLVLGARADSSLVRYGTAQLSVSAAFRLADTHPVWALLAEQGIDREDDLLIRRVVTADGKSKAFVNDQPVGVAFLKSVGDLLVEIHGQFASHRLLNPATHLGVLDMYGGLAPLVLACGSAYEIWRQQKAERLAAEAALEQAVKEEEFLRAAVADLEHLKPVKGEEAELVQQRTVLMNGEKIIESMNAAFQTLNGEDAGVAHQLAVAARCIERANQLTEGAFDAILTACDDAQERVAEAVSALESATEKWGDVDALPAIDDRLFHLRDMARRFQSTIDDLPDVLTRFKEQLVALEHGTDSIATLRKAEEKARLAYVSAARELSVKRHETAAQLDKLVARELPDLKLAKARFETHIVPMAQDDWNATGLDNVTFMVSTNAGVPVAPLNKVASGGELARFMLALKVNLAKAESIGTLVFDEVDSGVGGATAAAVGERLRRLGAEHQVLVVTHSPQVASFGRQHLTVAKGETDGCVTTRVTPLNTAERLQEIARMLSGAEITDTAREMAKELLGKAC